MAPTEFQQKLTTYTTGGLVCLAISLGKRLGLMEALNAVSTPANPATAEQVAEKANCSERYVKEWLSCLACADILEVNEEERFWIADEKKNDLITTPYTPLVQMQFTPNFAKPLDKLAEAFSNEFPRYGLDYSDFSEFYDVMNDMTRSMHERAMIPKMLPDIDDNLKAKLESDGLKVLDVGCGSGFHANFLAKNFPKSTFTGLDISTSAIRTANDNKEKDNLQNLSFVESTAASMPLEDNSFDLVTIFDACHDQQRPDLCMKEIYRVLKPGGTFAMIEIDGTSNVYKDKKREGIYAAMLYGCSMFHCLPVASNSPDALCLGAKWGVERGQKLLRDGGFDDVRVVDVPYFPLNCMYVCRK